MKREREEDEAAAADERDEDRKDEPAAARDDDAEEEDDNRIYLPTSTSRSGVRKGKDCPYLDTISRQVRSTSSAWVCMGVCMGASPTSTILLASTEPGF